MAVVHEVQAADAVDLDRRDRLAPPLRQGQAFPPGPHLVGGGPEVTVEGLPRIDRAHDRVQRNRLQPQVPFTAPAERASDLVERHDAVAVAAPETQPPRHRGQELAPPRPQEVVLGVGPGESGI
jgi:hypothetical protein